MAIRIVMRDFAGVALVLAALLLLPATSNAQRMGVPPNLHGVPSGMGQGSGRCEFKISGRLFPLGQPIPTDAAIIRLRFGDAILPLVLDLEHDLASLREQALGGDDLGGNYATVDRDLYQALLTKEVLLSFDHSGDEAQVAARSDMPDRLRVVGCIEGFTQPRLAVESVRRSH